MNKRSLHLLALAIVALAVAPALAADRPNIIFIMADDMGYGDAQALNAKSTIATPNLNRLATEGMTFTDAHTPSAVCTPTRYGVVTGRYCWRSRLKRGVLGGSSPPLIDPRRATVASVLKDEGYTTGIVGKWHLGLGFVRQGGDESNEFDFTKPLTSTPNVYGFEYSYIIPASLDMAPYVYVHNDRVTDPETVLQPGLKFPRFLRQGPRSKALEMEECLDHLTQKAVEFIRTNAKGDKPFMLYFPLPAPHKPAWPHERFVGKTGLGPYGDFVMQVDWTVGQVLKALDDLEIADRTLVICTSDNGSYMYRYDEPGQPDHVDDAGVQGYRAEHHRANGPWRGTKADIWEAGHRVPFFARWPGRVEAGSKCAKTICLTDFFATAAEIAGAKLTGDMAEDSFSILPLLRGKDWATPRAPVIHHSAGGMFAIRDGQWKLVLGNGSGGREQPKGRPFAKPYHLFDLSQDPGETNNLAEKHPEIVERLTAMCEGIRESGRSVSR